MWKPTSSTRLLCAAAFMALTATTATAQTSANYPSRPVRVILPYAPGGATSASLRIFADTLHKDMGQFIVVENRPGGGTIIGTQAVVRSVPDGYTMLLVNSTIALNRWLQASLPYDTLKDLVGVSTLVNTEDMIAVHSSVPANNLKELLSYARQNPGKITTRSQPGTGSEINMLLFMKATGTQFLLVPYSGAGAAVGDLLSGTLNFILSTPSNVIPLLKTGKLKPMAISGSKRHPTVPDVPTFAEAGLNNFEAAANWQMLLAPAATPRYIVQKLNTYVGRAQASKNVQEALTAVGFEPLPNSVAATNALLRSDIERFGKVVKEHNIKPAE